MAEIGMKEEQNPEMSFVDILAVLIRKRRIWMISLAVGVAVCLALIIVDTLKPRKITKPRYNACINTLILDASAADGTGTNGPYLGNMAVAVASNSQIINGMASELTPSDFAALVSSGIKAVYDEKSGVLSLSVTADSDKLALELVQIATKKTIEYMKGIAPFMHRTGAAGNSSGTDSLYPEPQFRMIGIGVWPVDNPAAPEKAFSPKKAVLVVLGMLLLGILLAFISNAWDKTKMDPEAMAKLEAAKKGK